MKTVWFSLVLFLSFPTASWCKGRTAPAVFPDYQNNRGIARNPAARKAPKAKKIHVPNHPDALGNRVTEDHLNRLKLATGRVDKVMKNDSNVTKFVSVGRAHFSNGYRHVYDHQKDAIDKHLHAYNLILVQHPHPVSLWRNHLFFGGFFYGFHAVPEIGVYFYNPMVFWFYTGSFNDYYYRNWYKTQYDAYPQLHRAFDYHGIYYPTENLRQLLFGISTLPVDRQANFHQAITVHTRKLAQRLANAIGTHVKLTTGNIVVTHYEILDYDDGIVLEGFVTQNDTLYNFKGLLNLQSPNSTEVFAPVSLDADPTPTQLQSLDALNADINQIRGDTASADTAAPGPVPAAELNVDPEPQISISVTTVPAAPSESPSPEAATPTPSSTPEPTTDSVETE